MRAAVIEEFGDPSGINIREYPRPEPASGEVEVRIEACSLNHRDLKRLQGHGVTSEDLPLIMGSDISGTVESVGPDVSDVQSGASVVLCPNITCGECDLCADGPENRCRNFSIYTGGFADRCVVSENRLIALPDNVDTKTAAALPIAFMTAWHMLQQANIAPDDVVFVAGATGGVGLAAVQLAEMVGATTIGTSTSVEKLDCARRFGLSHGIPSGDPNEIKEEVDMFPDIDVVINHLSGEYTALGLEILDRGGIMITCGQTAGTFSEIDMNDLYWDHKRLIGSTMGTQTDLERILKFVADGRIRPAIGAEYPLEQTADAFARLEDRSAFGKQIICPQG